MKLSRTKPMFIACPFFNTSSTYKNHFTALYDTNAPVLSNITPVNNQNVARGYIFQGDVSDASSVTVWVKLDGGSFAEVPVIAESWSTNFSDASYGMHTNWVYAVDAAGNTSETNEIAIVVILKKLIASDGAVDDEFGWSVAMSADGNTVIVGAHFDDEPTDDEGSAYWLRTADGGTTWTTNKLTASDGASNDYFGWSVAMSADGNTVIVGARGDNEGSAYWFHSTSGDGSFDITNKLTASDGASNDYFGWSVAMSADGNTVIVGAIYDDDPENSGSAYWFHSTSGDGSFDITNKLTAYDGANNDYFGWFVAMSADGNTVIVGAYGDDDPPDSGSAYWLRTADSGITWTTNKLTASDGAINDYFGNAVAMSADGNTVIIGARGDDDPENSGSAYWFHSTSSDGSFDITNKLTAYDGAINDYFGNAVAMSADGNTVIIGARGDAPGGSTYWLRTADGGLTWITNKLTAYDGANNDYFGNSVAMSANGNSWIVGAYKDDSSKGSAYWWGE